MSNNENNNLLSFIAQSKKIHLIYNKVIAVASLDKEYKESEIENIEQYFTKTTNRYLKALKTYHAQKTLKNPIDPALENLILRLDRRKTNLKLCKELVQSGWVLRDLSGWHKYGTPTGHESEFDTATLCKNGQTIKFKFDSSLECQEKGYHINPDPSVNVNLEDITEDFIKQISNQGLLEYENTVYTTLKTYREAKNITIEEYLRDLPTQNIQHIRKELKPIIIDAIEENKKTLDELYDNEDFKQKIESLKNQKIKDNLKDFLSDGPHKFRTKFSEKLNVLHDLQAPRITRSNEIDWRVKSNGQIEIGPQCGHLTHSSTLQKLAKDTLNNNRLNLKKLCLVDADTGKNLVYALTNAKLSMTEGKTPFIISRANNITNKDLTLDLFKEIIRSYMTHNQFIEGTEIIDKESNLELDLKTFMAKCTASREEIIDCLSKIFIFIKEVSVISDHVGICCDDCNIDTSKIDLKIQPHKEDSKKDVNEKEKSLTSINQLMAKFGKTKQTIETEIETTTIILQSIAEASYSIIDIGDHTLKSKNISAWSEQLKHYQICDEYKEAMMIEYIINDIDKITAYDLSSELEDIVNHLKTLLSILTKNLLKKLLADEININQNEISKYRFALLKTLSSAVFLTGEDKTDFEELYKKIELNNDDPNEQKVLNEAKVMNNEPKQDTFNISKATFKTAYEDCGPLNLILVAGMLGVGKSEFFDNASSTDKGSTEMIVELNKESKRVHVIRNIEKNTSDFDASTEPKEQGLLTIQKNEFNQFFDDTKVFALEKFQRLDDKSEGPDYTNYGSHEGYFKLIDKNLSKIENHTAHQDRIEKKMESKAGQTKVVGCACCSGRSLAATAISEIDRSLNPGLTQTDAVAVDSIGYADHSGMATVPNEKVFSRSFLNHTLTIVNLCDEQWKTIMDDITEYIGKNKTELQQILCNLENRETGNYYSLGEDKNSLIKKILEKEYDGSFNNVFINQLIHATHININNFDNQGRPTEGTITIEDFKRIHKIMNPNSQYTVNIETVPSNKKEAAKKRFFELISPKDQSKEANSRLKHQEIEAEPYKGDSELDQGVIQVDVAYYISKVSWEQLKKNPDNSQLDSCFDEFSDEQKLNYLKTISAYCKNSKIPRAKGHIKIKEQWFEYQVPKVGTLILNEYKKSKGKWEKGNPVTIDDIEKRDCPPPKKKSSNKKKIRECTDGCCPSEENGVNNSFPAYNDSERFSHNDSERFYCQTIN